MIRSRDWSINYLERSERQIRIDWSTNCLEQSERIRSCDWSTNYGPRVMAGSSSYDRQVMAGVTVGLSELTGLDYLSWALKGATLGLL